MPWLSRRVPWQRRTIPVQSAVERIVIAQILERPARSARPVQIQVRPRVRMAAAAAHAAQRNNMRNRSRAVLTWLALGLCVPLLLWVVQSRELNAARLNGPRIGQPLPAAFVHSLANDTRMSLTEASLRGGSCALIVLVNTHCGFCKRMRVTWPQQFHRWRDSVAAPIAPIWLSMQPEDTLRAFFHGYDFAGVAAGRLELGNGVRIGDLGVIGTPTSYLIDRRGRLRTGVIGNQLPSLDSARSACTMQ